MRRSPRILRRSSRKVRDSLVLCHFSLFLRMMCCRRCGCGARHFRSSCASRAFRDNWSPPFHRHYMLTRTCYPECKNSPQCSPAKHHFDECVERVHQQESEGEAKEDCVEECTFIHRFPLSLAKKKKANARHFLWLPRSSSICRNDRSSFANMRESS